MTVQPPTPMTRPLRLPSGSMSAASCSGKVGPSAGRPAGWFGAGHPGRVSTDL